MNFVVLWLFIPACFALNMSPGPNNLLAMSNGKRFGLKIAMLAGLGRIMAFAVMIALTAFGLAAVLQTSEKIFLVIKLIGGFYLLWLAYQLWMTKTDDDSISLLSNPRVPMLMRQELILAAGNPKAILIFTAFLPQFISHSEAVFEQFFFLGVIFLALEVVAILIYACFGYFLRQWFSRPAMRKLFNRICASLLGIAGIGLLFSSRQ